MVVPSKVDSHQPSVPAAVPDRQRPAIVIGGGVSGLTCAAYLASAGVPVTLLEARDQLGGTARPVRALGSEFAPADSRPGFSALVAAELDLASHGLVADDDRPEIAMSWLGGDPFIGFRSESATIEALRATHRYEVANYERYLKAAKPVIDLIEEITEADSRSSVPFRRLLDRRSSAAATLAKWNRRSAADVLRLFFETEPLRSAALVRGPVAAGRTPDLPGSGLSALAYALTHDGSAICATGAVDALESVILANGGSIITSARVSRIAADSQGVHAVILDSGEEFESGYVAVACDPRRALLSYLKPAPAVASSLIRKAEATPLPEGHVARIDAVLTEVPARRADVAAALSRCGLSDAGQLSTIVTPGATALSNGFRLLRHGAIAQRPPIAISLSAGSGASSPTLSIELFHAPHELSGGWPGSAEPARWIELAADVYGRELATAVGGWRITTPSDFDAEGLEPYRQHGLATTGSLGALSRRHRYDDHSTAIDGLFLCEAADVMASSSIVDAGRSAAGQILRNLGSDLTAAA